MVELLLGKREIISHSAEEATYGTFTDPTIILKNARVIPLSSEDWQEVVGTGADTIYPTREVGNKIRRLRLVYTPQDWRLLPFVFGSSTVSGTGPYTHTISGTAATLKSFSLQRNIAHTTPSVRKWSGVKVDRMTMSWNIGGGGLTGKFVEVELECVAHDVEIGTTAAGSPTAPSTDIFQARHVQLTLNGSVINELLSGTLVVENNLHDSMYADYSASGKISEPQPQIRRVSGTFVLHETDNTLINYQYNRTVVPGTNTLEFKRGTDDYLKLTFNNLRLTCPDETKLDGANVVNVKWDCDYVAVEIKDSISSYPDES